MSSEMELVAPGCSGSRISAQHHRSGSPYRERRQSMLLEYVMDDDACLVPTLAGQRKHPSRAQALLICRKSGMRMTMPQTTQFNSAPGVLNVQSVLRGCSCLSGIFSGQKKRAESIVCNLSVLCQHKYWQAS